MTTGTAKPRPLTRAERCGWVVILLVVMAALGWLAITVQQHSTSAAEIARSQAYICGYGIGYWAALGKRVPAEGTNLCATEAANAKKWGFDPR